MAYNLIGAFLDELHDLVSLGVLTLADAIPLVSLGSDLRQSLKIGGGF